MIDTNETGQRKWEEIIKSLHTGPWSEWDFRFINGLKGNRYDRLSDRQKTTIGDLYDKLVRG